MKDLTNLVKSILLGLFLAAMVFLALTISGCYRSNNLIQDHCSEKQKVEALEFYKRCLNNWDKLSEYGCQVRSVEYHCEVRPKVRSYL